MIQVGVKAPLIHDAFHLQGIALTCMFSHLCIPAQATSRTQHLPCKFVYKRDAIAQDLARGRNPSATVELHTLFAVLLETAASDGQSLRDCFNLAMCDVDVAHCDVHACISSLYAHLRQTMKLWITKRGLKVSTFAPRPNVEMLALGRQAMPGSLVGLLRSNCCAIDRSHEPSGTH